MYQVLKYQQAKNTQGTNVRSGLCCGHLTAGTMSTKTAANQRKFLVAKIGSVKSCWELKISRAAVAHSAHRQCDQLIWPPKPLLSMLPGMLRKPFPPDQFEIPQNYLGVEMISDQTYSSFCMHILDYTQPSLFEFKAPPTKF